MTYSFSLCAECLAKYRSLGFDSAAPYTLCIMPLCSLLWPDEHPDGRIVSPKGHEQCRASIIRLANARTQWWRSGVISAELQELWDEARRLIPNWPGFQRLTLDPSQRHALDGCAEELGDLMGAIRKDFPHVTVSDEGGSLGSFTARRDTECMKEASPESPRSLRQRDTDQGNLPLSSPPKDRRWWQFWK